ncbi:hypothetical protein F5B18DRAFT_648016 [Nemania serpens]|nr:hypothetical protein F5B18DRAFT_648016 [Nemania serpens]
MPTTDKGTASTSHPRTAPSTSQRRPLFKGTLSPPSTKPTGKSYTLAPVSISEVLIRDPAERRATGRRSTAISSTAVPQPFVDPSVLQRRPPSAS